MSECCGVQPFHPSNFDDEIAALSLQLEEIALHTQNGKGKHPVDQPPDVDIAYASYQAELQDYKAFLADQQLARSIGVAVYSDGPVIAELTSEEIQCHEDRLVALQTSNTDPGYERPPRLLSQNTDTKVREWMCTATESQYVGSVVDFSDASEIEAGPSKSYAERQAEALEKLSVRIKCVVCHENVYSGLTIKLPCNDQYCVDCLKRLFVRATKDESLFPVKCHKQPIPLQLISKYMSTDELAAFKRASVEFSTANRVHCSNRDCAQFIPPDDIELGTNRAECKHCHALTCGLCKNKYHNHKDCPDDPELRRTRELASELGWQSCHRCGSMVILKSGCNHMTCRCKAEFCYVCGTAWKNCSCPHADPHRILERAEEIVDRDAVIVLPQIERERRVRQVRTELEQNHECEHPGKFQRIFDGGRRGFRCEMCDERHWKYILQCRHCFVNVCEDCRRNRV